MDYLLATLLFCLLMPAVFALVRWYFFPHPDSKRGVRLAFKRELNAVAYQLRQFHYYVLSPHKKNMLQMKYSDDRLALQLKIESVEFWVATMWTERKRFWMDRFKEVKLPISDTYFEDVESGKIK